MNHFLAFGKILNGRQMMKDKNFVLGHLSSVVIVF